METLCDCEETKSTPFATWVVRDEAGKSLLRDDNDYVYLSSSLKTRILQNPRRGQPLRRRSGSTNRVLACFRTMLVATLPKTQSLCKRRGWILAGTVTCSVRSPLDLFGKRLSSSSSWTTTDSTESRQRNCMWKLRVKAK